MKSVLSILLLFAGVEGFAAGFNPYDGPVPLAVVLGADTPRVVVYENGSVIFLRESGDRPWPRHWPGLGSNRSFKRGDSYSIFLDGSVLPELGEFLGGGPVEANGKKWAVSYRYVFPSAPVWSKHFQYRPDKAIPD